MQYLQKSYRKQKESAECTDAVLQGRAAYLIAAPQLSFCKIITQKVLRCNPCSTPEGNQSYRM